jgi:hypothetical protein
MLRLLVFIHFDVAAVCGFRRSLRSCGCDDPFQDQACVMVPLLASARFGTAGYPGVTILRLEVYMSNLYNAPGSVFAKSKIIYCIWTVGLIRLERRWVLQ